MGECYVWEILALSVMKVEELGSGYYITEAYVETGTNIPTVNDYDYRELQYEVHKAGSDEQSIIVQLDNVFFEIEPSESVPTDVLYLPESALEKTHIKNPPTRRGLMIPKPWFYKYLREPEYDETNNYKAR